MGYHVLNVCANCAFFSVAIASHAPFWVNLSRNSALCGASAANANVFVSETARTLLVAPDKRLCGKQAGSNLGIR